MATTYDATPSIQERAIAADIIAVGMLRGPTRTEQCQPTFSVERGGSDFGVCRGSPFASWRISHASAQRPRVEPEGSKALGRRFRRSEGGQRFRRERYFRPRGGGRDPWVWHACPVRGRLLQGDGCAAGCAWHHLAVPRSRLVPRGTDDVNFALASTRIRDSPLLADRACPRRHWLGDLRRDLGVCITSRRQRTHMAQVARSRMWR